MKAKDLTREQIFVLVEEARAQKKNKKDHVKQKLEQQHPELVGQTIRRNGQVYDAIEYLMGDVESYGTSA